MKHQTENIIDDNGIELLVSYEWEQEAGNKPHDIEVGLMVYTELKTCEIVIGGVGIDLMPLMSEGQKEFIISKLNY